MSRSEACSCFTYRWSSFLGMWIVWGRLIKAELACCVGYTAVRSDLELARTALVGRRRCLYIGPYTWDTHSVPRNTFQSAVVRQHGHVILSRLVNTRHTRGYSCTRTARTARTGTFARTALVLLLFVDVFVSRSHINSIKLVTCDCRCCCCASLCLYRWINVLDQYEYTIRVAIECHRQNNSNHEPQQPTDTSTTPPMYDTTTTTTTTTTATSNHNDTQAL